MISSSRYIAAVSALLLLTGAGCLEKAPAVSTGDEARMGTVTMEEANAPQRATAGTIISVNLDAMAWDGPGVVILRTEAGAEETIHLPSFGLGLCAAKDQLADTFTLRVGDEVEVNGSVSEEGAITPCRLSSHYLRVK